MQNGIIIESEGLDRLVQNISTIPIQRFLRDIMSSAEAMVDMFYAPYADTGNTSYRTKVTSSKNTATLTVSGEDVGFLEFGAGFGVSLDEFALQVPYFVSPGSYSIYNGREFIEKGFWYYAKVRYDAIPATHGMQAALDLVRTEIQTYLHDRIMQYIWNGFISSRTG